MQDVKNLARSKSAFALFVGSDEAGGSGTARTESIKVMGTAAAVVLDSAESSAEETDQDTPHTEGSAPNSATREEGSAPNSAAREEGSAPNSGAREEGSAPDSTTPQ